MGKIKNKMYDGLIPKSYTAYDTILLPKKISIPEDGSFQNNVNKFTFFEFQEGLSFDDDKKSDKNIKDKRYTNMCAAKSFPPPQKFEFYNVSLSIPYFSIEKNDIFKLMASSDLIVYVYDRPFLTLAWDILEDYGGSYYYKGVWRGRESCRIEMMGSLHAELRFEKLVEFNDEMFVKIGLDGILYTEIRCG